jgi:hypothetical protein
MENRYEKGSTEWELLESARKLSTQAATNDKTADAIDRLSIALLQVGAALSASLTFAAQQVGEVAEEIREKRMGQ